MKGGIEKAQTYTVSFSIKQTMRDKTRSSLPLFLKITMDILIIAGILVFGWSIFTSLPDLSNSLTFSEITTVILFIIGSISLILILFYLRGVIDSLVKRAPFIWSNVYNLKKISICSFIISICYIINIFVNKQYVNLKIVSIDKMGVHTDLEFIIFFFAGFFIFILSEVFKQAVKYKEENDLTI